MEWVVHAVVELVKGEFYLLRVRNEIRQNFIVIVFSKFNIQKRQVLTPVISGYMIDHQKDKVITIQEVMPYKFDRWEWILAEYRKK